ncbi:MAG: RadC family protein [Butyricicoccus sp.]
MSVHDGHRERMKQRFLEHGLDNFSEHEVLELLLYYSIPRGDVNPITHNLLNQFETLSGVLEADPAELKKVEGVGDKTATLLHLLPPLFRRYRMSQHQKKALDSAELIGQYLVDYYIGHTNELLTVLLLDNRCHLLAVKALAEGDPRSVRVNYRALAAEVLRRNAANVILAHNHPGGVCVPSREDFVETRMVRDFLQKIGVKLIDHIIVAGEEWTSVTAYSR